MKRQPPGHHLLTEKPPSHSREGRGVSGGSPLGHRAHRAKDFTNIRFYPPSFKSLLRLPEARIFHATSKLRAHTLVVSSESARAVVDSVLQQQNGSRPLGTCSTPGTILPTVCPRV